MDASKSSSSLPSRVASSQNHAGSGNAYPKIDPRFQRFANFKTETGTYATLVYGHAGKPKVLKYDVATLVKKGGFLTALSAKGTIFSMDCSVAKSLAMYFVIAGLCFCGVFFTGDVLDFDFDYTKLESVSNYLNAFIPFMLGLYTSLALARWWALRTDGIGKVLDSAQNVVLICVAVLPGPEFQEWHDQVIKYALASVSLIVQTVRNKENVEALGPKQDNLLTAEEVAILADMPIRPRPVVMWSWICALCTKVMEEQGIPPGKSRDVVAACVTARDGIQLIWTYLGTQLPFAYVHLVTFLVNLNNLVMAIKCGVVFAAAVKQRNWIHAGSQLVFIFVVPLLYQGLLSVSYVIHDPFGEDLLDFPVMAFQEYMNEASLSITHYTGQCPALAQEFGPPPSKRALALRKGMGRVIADRLAATDEFDRGYENQDAVDDTDGEVVESPLLTSLREQIRVKEELATSLQQQNQLLESNVTIINTRLRSLESQLFREQSAFTMERGGGWCTAPARGDDRIREAAVVGMGSS